MCNVEELSKIFNKYLDVATNTFIAKDIILYSYECLVQPDNEEKARAVLDMWRNIPRDSRLKIYSRALLLDTNRIIVDLKMVGVVTGVISSVDPDLLYKDSKKIDKVCAKGTDDSGCFITVTVDKDTTYRLVIFKVEKDRFEFLVWRPNEAAIVVSGYDVLETVSKYRAIYSYIDSLKDIIKLDRVTYSIAGIPMDILVMKKKKKDDVIAVGEYLLEDISITENIMKMHPIHA
ncbi:MAG: hypothetical protein ACO2O0_09410 [Desulfurococcales archaeon]|jgi:hypothetical protein